MAYAVGAPAERHGLRLALIVSASVLVSMSIWIIDRDVQPPTSYASLSNAALLTDLGVGIALLAAGWMAHTTSPDTPVGTITALMALVWFAGDWIGWLDGPPAARTLAMVIAPFLLPLAAQLALATPSWQSSPAALRWLVGTTYALTAAWSLGRALFRDPLLDRYCWNNCEDNVLLIRAEPELARMIDTSALRVAVVIGMIVAAAAGWRMIRATPVARRSSGWVSVPAGAVAAVLAACAAVLLVEPAEDPERTVFAATFYARAAALLVLALGVGWHATRIGRTRRAVKRLAQDLGANPSPGSLQSALSEMLRDDQVRVVFRMSDSDRFVDEKGHRVEVAPGPGQTTTAINRGGRPIALVFHDRSHADVRDVERAIGATARLAVDNERLRAETLARLDDVRASRARIVEVADATRRRLERDLHDGAQQRLLAVSYELRLAAMSSEEGPSARHSLLSDAMAETQLALSELRDLAHGISPVVLFEAGLDAAVQSFADRSPMPVTVECGLTNRYSDAVETSAYTVAVEAVELAHENSATFARVEILEDRSHLVVTIRHDGGEFPRASVLPFEDRVGAIGGWVNVARGCVEARMPCVS